MIPKNDKMISAMSLISPISSMTKPSMLQNESALIIDHEFATLDEKEM